MKKLLKLLAAAAVVFVLFGRGKFKFAIDTDKFKFMSEFSLANVLPIKVITKSK